jgi:hypothetical protein
LGVILTFVLKQLLPQQFIEIRQFGRNLISGNDG